MSSVSEGALGWAAGLVDPRFEPVAARFGRYFGTGPGGGALAVTLRGRRVIDVCAGYADAAAGRRWTPETTTLVFSTTKALAATVVHRLADRGALDYDAPVAAVWPEFGVADKDRITLRQLLAHRAGLHNVRGVVCNVEDTLDHLTMEDRLARRPADGRAGRPGYHAYTYGWLLAGLARRVTGKGMAELIHDELAVPLGVTGLALGAAPADVDSFAPLVGPAAHRLNALRRVAMPALRTVR